ncbi:MAG: hypothetical protein ABF695_12245 [Liquorilactobacillus ghanensis]|uniref:hypothetical protein n=1 Tax=Liquorilactobacillus ghanensis TaxID=399370 RepID=UPI0039E95F4C
MNNDNSLALTKIFPSFSKDVHDFNSGLNYYQLNSISNIFGFLFLVLFILFLIFTVVLFKHRKKKKVFYRFIILSVISIGLSLFSMSQYIVYSHKADNKLTTLYNIVNDIRSLHYLENNNFDYNINYSGAWRLSVINRYTYYDIHDTDYGSNDGAETAYYKYFLKHGFDTSKKIPIYSLPNTHGKNAKSSFRGSVEGYIYNNKFYAITRQGNEVIGIYKAFYDLVKSNKESKYNLPVNSDDLTFCNYNNYPSIYEALDLKLNQYIVSVDIDSKNYILYPLDQNNTKYSYFVYKRMHYKK